TRNGDDSSKQQQNKADAVHGKVIFNAERRNPRNANHGEQRAGSKANDPNDDDGETDDGRDERDDPRRSCIGLWPEHQSDSADEANVNGPGEHGLEPHLGKKLDNGAVHRAHNQLGIETEDKHQSDGGQQRQALACAQIWHSLPALVYGAVEDSLQKDQEEDGGEEQSDEGKRRGPGDERKSPFEDQKFARKTVQPGQPQRGEDRDAHQSAKDGRDLAQSAEFVDPAPSAAALLQHRDKPEEHGCSERVIEHLEKDAVHGGGAFYV